MATSGEASPYTDGRDRLLDAAERLIALKGVDGVSLREITAAADHRNHSAIAYHFRDRTGLVEAIWHRRTETVGLERAALMLDLRSGGRERDLRSLVEAYVVPLANEIGRRRPSYWARFNETWLTTLPLDFLDGFIADQAERDPPVPLQSLSQLFDCMRTLVAENGTTDASRRVALASRFVITALATWERESEQGRQAPESLKAYTEEVVDLVLAMLQAPTPDAS